MRCCGAFLVQMLQRAHKYSVSLTGWLWRMCCACAMSTKRLKSHCRHMTNKQSYQLLLALEAHPPRWRHLQSVGLHGDSMAVLQVHVPRLRDAVGVLADIGERLLKGKLPFSFFLGGCLFLFQFPMSSPQVLPPLSLSGLWVADAKPLSPCPLSQLLRVTLLRIKYLLT